MYIDYNAALQWAIAHSRRKWKAGATVWYSKALSDGDKDFTMDKPLQPESPRPKSKVALNRHQRARTAPSLTLPLVVFRQFRCTKACFMPDTPGQPGGQTEVPQSRSRLPQSGPRCRSCVGLLAFQVTTATLHDTELSLKHP